MRSSAGTGGGRPVVGLTLTTGGDVELPRDCLAVVAGQAPVECVPSRSEPAGPPPAVASVLAPVWSPGIAEPPEPGSAVVAAGCPDGPSGCAVSRPPVGRPGKASVRSNGRSASPAAVKTSTVSTAQEAPTANHAVRRQVGGGVTGTGLTARSSSSKPP